MLFRSVSQSRYVKVLVGVGVVVGVGLGTIVTLISQEGAGV